MHKAASIGHLEKILLLLNAGANVNEHNNDGDTPLVTSVSKPWYSGYGIHTADADPRPSMTKLLLQRSASVNRKTTEVRARYIS